jgi:glycosyltransferase involved in cell wall biosynthesis
MKLSVIILTHNNQDYLSNCLKSVAKIAKEIIVCDKGSSDRTLEIAKKAGTRIIKYSGQYFDEWRNLAASQAKGNWLLYVDSDERLSRDLIKEIRKIINKEDLEYSAYQISRKNYWWGKEFVGCGASPDYVTRLIKKDKLKKWQGIIHESPIIDGDIGTLNNQIIHLTHRDLVSGLQKSYQWTEMEAQLFHQAGHKKVKIKNLLSVMVKTFFKKYIKQKGYKEGIEGFIESTIQAINRFMVYVNLWQMQQKPSLEKKYQELDK